MSGRAKLAAGGVQLIYWNSRRALVFDGLVAAAWTKYASSFNWISALRTIHAASFRVALSSTHVVLVNGYPEQLVR